LDRPAARPRFSRFLLLAAANRTAGYAITGYLSSIIAGQREHAIAIGLKTGLVIGIVTAIAGCFTPSLNAMRIASPKSEWACSALPRS
jgi:hypothetical protein